jgi:hypothetical protein
MSASDILPGCGVGISRRGNNPRFSSDDIDVRPRIIKPMT